MAALTMLRAKSSLGLLLLVLALAIGACGGSDSPDATATVTPPETTAASSGGAPSTSTSVPQATAPQPTTQTGSGGGATSTSTPVPQPSSTQTSSGGFGGTVGLDDALDEAIRLYEDLIDALATVTDEASARAAAPHVASIIDKFEGLDNLMGDYTDAEIANAALSSRFFGFGQELSNEMIRIAANPAVFVLLAEAFEDLENLGEN